MIEPLVRFDATKAGEMQMSERKKKTSVTTRKNSISDIVTVSFSRTINAVMYNL